MLEFSFGRPLTRVGLGWYYLYLGACFGNWAARVPDIKAQHGLSDGLLGVIYLTAVLGAICSMPLVSFLSNNFGTGRAVLIGAVCNALLVPIVSIDGNIWVFLVGMITLGFSTGTLDISTSSQAVLFERIQEEKIIGALYATYNIGSFLGVLYGGILAGYGVSPLYDFVILGAFGLVLSILFFPFLIQYDEEIQKPAISKSFQNESLAEESQSLIEPDVQNAADDDSSEVNMNFQLKLLCVMGFITFLGVGCVNDWSTIYFRDSIHTSGVLTSSGYALYQVALATGQLLSDHFVVKFGSNIMLKISGITTFIGTFLLFLAPSFPSSIQIYVAVAALGIAGAGLSSINPIIIASAGKLSFKGLTTPDIVGIVTTSIYVGFLVGPPLFGGLSQLSGGLRWSFLLDSFLMLSITVFAFFTRDLMSNKN